MLKISLLAILPGFDVFILFIMALAIIFIVGIISIFQKKKRDSEKVDRRFSSLKNEFDNLKSHKIDNNQYDLIKEELEDNYYDYEEMVLLNRK